MKASSASAWRPGGGEEKLHGLRTLVEHYGYDACPLDMCRGLKNTVIHKVVLAELMGKRNLPGSG